MKNERTMKDRYELLLVDDHRILLDGTEKLLHDQPRFIVRDAAETKAAALKLLDEKPYDILVADYRLPDGTGLDVVRHAKGRHPDILVIVLTMHDDVGIVRELLKEGVRGYMLKSDPYASLLTALERVTEGKRYFSEAVAELLAAEVAAPAKPSVLSPREREIVHLVAKEHMTVEIADMLCISEKTVETHRKNILRKTGCKNWAGLIVYAFQHGLIDAEAL